MLRMIGGTLVMGEGSRRKRAWTVSFVHRRLFGNAEAAGDRNAWGGGVV